MLYIPVCPVTETNAEYLLTQRHAFLAGIPGPDFPGGKGESKHIGRPGEDDVTSEQGRRALGLERLHLDGEMLPGGREVLQRANEILGLLTAKA